MVADIAKLSVGREEYYTRELATDHEQYLSGHGESPGRWYGASASSLGLEGEASVAGFQAMFEGRDPTTGELLGRPHGRNAVPTFDVVLRPTKSISILYGLGDAATGRAVLAAHHAGLAEAVALPGRALGCPPWSWRCPARVRPAGAGGRVRPPDLQRRRSAAAHPPGPRQPRPGSGRTLDGLGRPRPLPESAGRRRHLPDCHSLNNWRALQPDRTLATGGAATGRVGPRTGSASSEAGAAAASCPSLHGYGIGQNHVVRNPPAGAT